MLSLLTGSGQEVGDGESAEWPDEFTREEMLEQQNILLVEECRMLQEDLTRYRQNLAKMVDLNMIATTERDKLRRQLDEHISELSKMRLNACEHWKTINGMKIIIAQRGELLRQFKIPEQYLGACEPDQVPEQSKEGL
jgi:regulator of replication initiation timing